MHRKRYKLKVNPTVFSLRVNNENEDEKREFMDTDQEGRVRKTPPREQRRQHS